MMAGASTDRHLWGPASSQVFPSIPQKVTECLRGGGGVKGVQGGSRVQGGLGFRG